MKGIIRNFALAIFAILITTNCTPKVEQIVKESNTTERDEQKAEANQKPKDIVMMTAPYVVAAIKTTPCYGKCPVYEATLYSDGKVTWFGKKFTERIGRFETKVSEEVVADVRSKIKEGGIFFLEDSYPSQRKLFITDLPNTVISISNGAQPKVITDNHGAPKNLLIFEDYLKAFFEGIDWTKQ